MTPPPPTSPVISEQKAPMDEKQMNESHQDGMNPQEIKNFKKSEVVGFCDGFMFCGINYPEVKLISYYLIFSW